MHSFIYKETNCMNEYCYILWNMQTKLAWFIFHELMKKWIYEAPRDLNCPVIWLQKLKKISFILNIISRRPNWSFFSKAMMYWIIMVPIIFHITKFKHMILTIGDGGYSNDSQMDILIFFSNMCLTVYPFNWDCVIWNILKNINSCFTL